MLAARETCRTGEQGQGELLAQTQESLSKGRFPVSTQGPWLHKDINNPDKMEAKCGQYVLPGRETRKPGRREGEAKEIWVHFVLFYFLN